VPRRSVPRIALPSTIVAAVVATMVLLGTYLTTAAPDLTFWDAAEFMTAAHTLGIPHPPGTPLWVLIANVAQRVLGGDSPARAVTLLSVVAAAATGGVGAFVATRWIGARGATVAAVLAGSMYTVWANATETEVYAVALLLAVTMLACGEWAGRHDVSPDTRQRARALLAFLAGLAIPLHLSALVALPAAVALAWRGPRPDWRDAAVWGALALLGVSVVAVLPLRSQHDPALDSGNPETWRALVATLRREQYDVPGLWPRRAPLWLQLGNVFQWADWQVAYGLHPLPTAAVARTGLTLLWAWLGALGVRALWRHERRVGAAMIVLLGCASLGVAVWLNLRVGPSFGVGVLPDDALHEVRERDYFFALAFWAWGLCAGAGATALMAPLRRRVPTPLALLPLLLVAAVPLLANRPVADRTREPVASLPRTYARLLLESVPENGVLITAGDNDTFPLWYLQQVEELRADVSVVTVPMLGAPWYRVQLAEQGLLDAALVGPWRGIDRALQSVADAAARDRRALRVSAQVTAAERRLLDPASGWMLEGLVYAPSAAVPPGQVMLDTRRMRQAHEAVPRSAWAPLPPGTDPAAQVVQDLLRCTAVTHPADTLLVSGCGGV
jgi:hypothetical protein